MTPSIAVVTPWHNHGELAAAYFHAMHAAQPDEVIVIDNGSDPALSFADVRFDQNRGFHPACNYGLDAAQSDAVLFLNNDIVLTDASWLDAIRAELRPGVLVGAQMREDAHTAVDGRTEPYLDGWCLAGMRADLHAIGGWDESLEEPAYYGDNLLCLYARAAGLALVEARVGLRHLGNVTSGEMVDQRTAASIFNFGIYQRAVRAYRKRLAVAA